MASPSVCAGATWMTWTSSPLRCSVTSSAKVTTGSAAGGCAFIFISLSPMWRTASTPRRLRTFSWATMTAPAAARAGLLPVWSMCQWVLMTKRTGFFDSAPSAAFSLAVIGSSSSSMMNRPSSPTEAATLPPAKPLVPSIIEMPPVTGVVLSVTLVGSPICARAVEARAAAARRTRS